MGVLSRTSLGQPRLQPEPVRPSEPNLCVLVSFRICLPVGVLSGLLLRSARGGFPGRLRARCAVFRSSPHVGSAGRRVVRSVRLLSLCVSALTHAGACGVWRPSAVWGQLAVLGTVPTSCQKLLGAWPGAVQGRPASPQASGGFHCSTSPEKGSWTSGRRRPACEGGRGPGSPILRATPLTSFLAVPLPPSVPPCPLCPWSPAGRIGHLPRRMGRVGRGLSLRNQTSSHLPGPFNPPLSRPRLCRSAAGPAAVRHRGPWPAFLTVSLALRPLGHFCEGESRRQLSSPLF